jgi:hypothetical protein
MNFEVFKDADSVARAAAATIAAASRDHALLLADQAAAGQLAAGHKQGG